VALKLLLKKLYESIEEGACEYALKRLKYVLLIFELFNVDI
jgi:hypothetical protein